MHHIPYALALTHRDELVRQAAVLRLVRRPALSLEAAPRHSSNHPRRVRRLRYAVRG
jgi:hypothetical protein